MAAEEPVTRNQKISGANAIMDFGYVTERTIPEMMDRAYAQQFLLEVQDELQLRSLTVPVVMQTFNYYMAQASSSTTRSGSAPMPRKRRCNTNLVTVNK
ncbi:hypothetical protein [Lacticaseibacillus sharpeae]|uniref:hypothetical protein n=1 Tax=Lacticaseibacillus sharpeae TaxID=1626 RepID=UPI000AEEFE61|nr:hypothetical protein [Lacticaseibacillus sharpeae]